jgi:hypothetical protein
MSIKKWFFQYTLALPIIFVVLAYIQYLKGRSIDYSVEFGILWALISVAVFAMRRMYNYRKNINCSLCNDLPKNSENTNNKESKAIN